MKQQTQTYRLSVSQPRPGWALSLLLSLVLGTRLCAQEKPAAVEEKPVPAKKEQTPVPKEADAQPAPKEKRQEGDAKEKAKPKREVHPDEWVDRPGAPRPALPAFRQPTPLVAKQPTPAEMDQFDQMKTGKIEASDAVIDAVAKYLVYSLTDAVPKKELSAHVDDVIRNIPTERNTRAKSTNFVRLYRQKIAKYGKDLIGNSVEAKANLMMLLQRLSDGTDDVGDPVEVYLAILEDPSQDDASRYMALRSIDLAKERGIVGIEQERRAISAILKLVNERPVQSVLLEKIIDTIGALGRPFRVNPEFSEVGTFLAKVVLDDEQSLRIRQRAAVALGNLKAREVPSWNYELQTLVFASMLRDLIKAEDEGKSLGGDDTFRWMMFRMGLAMDNINRQAGENPDVNSLYKIVDPILSQVVQKDGAKPDLEPLEKWIEQHQKPKSNKIAIRAEEISLPGPK
ncbi:MAG: hypothetical protein U1D30_09510 [Planctomycetota bacterium]